MTREEILKTYWEVSAVWHSISLGSMSTDFALRALGNCLKGLDPNTALWERIGELQHQIIVGSGRKSKTTDCADILTFKAKELKHG